VRVRETQSSKSYLWLDISLDSVARDASGLFVASGRAARSCTVTSLSPTNMGEATPKIALGAIMAFLCGTSQRRAKQDKQAKQLIAPGPRRGRRRGCFLATMIIAGTCSLYQHVGPQLPLSTTQFLVVVVVVVCAGEKDKLCVPGLTCATIPAPAMFDGRSVQGIATEVRYRGDL
jgi:hypothetical protein